MKQMVIGKTALFLATAFLRRFCHICLELDHPVFTSLDFATVICVQSKVISFAFNPQLGGPGLYIYVPCDRVVQLHPQAPGTLFITFYDLQGYSGGILTRLHMGQ
jgi:hypothetical protein